jgi:nucleotide-binding universal stress UspA family protein
MKNKYKILVLSDVNNYTEIILKNAVSLAKMIDGEIDLLCIKKPAEIVKEDNQLSAMRTINQKHFSVDKKIQKLVNSFSKDYNININYTLSYGNVKQEINKHIKKHQPDVVVLGKRKSKLLKLVGDKITNYVLKKHKGAVMLSSLENTLEPEDNIALGMLNEMEDSFEFAKRLTEQTQKPIKSFKLVNKIETAEHSISNNKDTIEYVFEENENVISNLSNYLLKSNINLLFVNREKINNKCEKHLIKSGDDKVDVSLLLTA